MVNQQLTTRQEKILSNLRQALTAIEGICTEAEGVSFVVCPVDDQPTQYTSTDDVMRLTVHKAGNLLGRRWDITTIVPMLTAPNDKFPLWVELRLLDVSTVEMRVSRRFRHYRKLRNQETGHPPFKVMNQAA